MRRAGVHLTHQFVSHHTRPGWRGSCISGFSTDEPAAADLAAAKVAGYRGIEMKGTLSIATIGIMCAAGHPIAASVAMPLARRSQSVDLTRVAGQNTANVWDGKWEGTTVSGHPLVLQIKMQGQRMTG